MRGGEKVLEAIAELYPGATIHTLLHVKGSVSPALERHPGRRSFVQWLPSSGSGTFWHLLMQAFALGWYFAAAHMRLTRSSMLEVLGS